MPIYKRCPRCGKRIPVEQVCGCEKKRHKEYNTFRTDTKEQKLYWSDDWDKAKAAAVWQCCGVDLYSFYVKKKLETGQTVHHIIPLKDNWERRLDLGNLIYLTEENHQYVHKKMKESEEEKEKIIVFLFDLKKRFNQEFSQGRGWPKMF